MSSSPDPQIEQQKKMMVIMFVFFGFIFYSVPSGLVLYFLTSSLIGLIEQRITKMRLEKAGTA